MTMKSAALMPQPRAQHQSPDQPGCPVCGAPMLWKRTRPAFTARGVTAVAAFVCEPCEEVVQIEVS
jgi:hypothetical protein